MFTATEKALSVTVLADDFAAGNFPNVCPQSGLLAIERRVVVASGAKTGPSLRGSMYWHSTAVRAQRICFVSLVLGFFAAAVCAGMGAMFDNVALLVLAILCLIGTLGWAALVLPKLTKARSTGTNLVKIAPVARDFYDAMALRPVKCAGCGDGSCCSDSSTKTTPASIV